MKRFIEIFAKNAHTFEVEQAQENGCKPPTLEQIKENIEDGIDESEGKVFADTIKEWYKEKTGKDLEE